MTEGRLEINAQGEEERHAGSEGRKDRAARSMSVPPYCDGA